jgi:hypothetical protein
LYWDEELPPVEAGAELLALDDAEEAEDEDEPEEAADEEESVAMAAPMRSRPKNVDFMIKRKWSR